MAEIPFPGSYIEEVPFGAQSIEGVGTSTVGFVGAVASGPVGTAVRVRTWIEYERAFGGLASGLEFGYAVRQFFANGGKDAFVAGLPEGVPLSQGVEALDAVPEIALFCLPGESDPNVLRPALAWADRRRAFLIVDAPREERHQAVELAGVLAESGGANAAVYYPWVRVADPLREGVVRECPPSGSVAGLYARTDRAQGVWTAPAGVEAILLGVDRPAMELSEGDVDALTTAGVNCIRILPGVGTVVWSARTVHGTAETGSEWKYVAVRRSFLFLEESLHRGSQWAVFEPNEEPLWAKLRFVVGEFLDGLWRAGAFHGEKAKDAYFVRCDRDTMTQEDIDAGRVTVVVGFAPLKPAEFINVRIQRLTDRVVTEVLGRGTGQPGQRLSLPSGRSRGTLLLRVEEPGGWTTWSPVASLLGSGPTDRVFTIERTDRNEVVVFGDAEHGALPPDGSTIRVTYGFGGGSGGRRRRSERPTAE